MIILNEDLIIKRLIELEMDWESLAEAIDISSTTLWRYRSGITTKISFEIINKIANYLDIDIKDIIKIK